VRDEHIMVERMIGSFWATDVYAESVPLRQREMVGYPMGRELGSPSIAATGRILLSWLQSFDTVLLTTQFWLNGNRAIEPTVSRVALSTNQDERCQTELTEVSRTETLTENGTLDARCWILELLHERMRNCTVQYSTLSCEPLHTQSWRAFSHSSKRRRAKTTSVLQNNNCTFQLV
jgi:hypothetical protein